MAAEVVAVEASGDFSHCTVVFETRNVLNDVEDATLFDVNALLYELFGEVHDVVDDLAVAVTVEEFHETTEFVV